MLNVKATIEISRDDITSLVSEYIKNTYGLDIDPSIIRDQYEGNYDTTNFDGFVIELNTDQIKTALTK